MLEFWTEPELALRDADAVYTDIWVSMGESPDAWAERIEALLPYQVNAKAMSLAKPGAIFMHCLPAFHDHKTVIGREVGEKYGLDALEVTDEGLREPAERGLRRGREPPAHDKSRHGRHAERPAVKEKRRPLPGRRCYIHLRKSFSFQTSSGSAR